MKLSVIIPCYNAAGTLGAQLAALACQDFPEPWEVVLADNGSTDESIALAESFRGRLPALRVVLAWSRRGAAHARNCGAREARSDALVFCDADDEVAPGYLRAMSRALSEHSFVACRYDFDKLNHRWITRCHRPSQLTAIDHGLLGPYRYAGGGSLGVRKTVHDKVDGFDETLPALEDTDYCIRIQRTGVSLNYVPEALVHVRWRGTARQTFLQARAWGRGYVTVRERHCPGPDATETARSLVRHLVSGIRVRTARQMAEWVWLCGWKLGSLEGEREKVNNNEVPADFNPARSSTMRRPPSESI